ncbi:hypothetical protein FG386_000060 [Cryptosporidium ryanae]|uniref:uncharacterized protein n=1 Tax=Cryptosporidium ryanae TaxID=515981 RepID=UPI00351A1B09|nr:hypothetical protein FG386_000060 [Cryptosporidium ryanae]
MKSVIKVCLVLIFLLCVISKNNYNSVKLFDEQVVFLNGACILNASLVRLKYKEKGFLKRAANAAGRLLFGIDTTRKESVNTERIPVGLFPAPNVLAAELDQLENRKIKKNTNSEAAVNYVEDKIKGLTPNTEFLSSNVMATLSDGAISRGSSDEVKLKKKDSVEEIMENKEREQSLQSQGQTVKESEKIKVGKKGPVTIEDPDSDKKGKTTPPKLVIVDDEDNFGPVVSQNSILNNPFIIVLLFVIVVLIFSGGGLVFFKKFKKLNT